MSMTLTADRRTPAALTALARASAQIAMSEYALSAYLPEETNETLQYNFSLNSIGLTDAASYRAWDTSAPLGRETGSRSAGGQLPPMNKKFRVTEFEQLLMQIGSETAIGEKFDEYARRLGRSFAARVALAQAEGIQTGKLTLHENGLNLELDYGRDPDLTIEAPVKVSDPDAKILDYLEAAQAVYRAKNGGVNPAIKLVSPDIEYALTRNKELIALNFGRGTDLPSRIGVEDVRGVLANFGYRGFRTFEGAIDNVPLLDTKSIVFLPDAGQAVNGQPLGTTQWGITSEAINPAYGISAGRAGIFCGAFHVNDPEGQYVYGSAVAIPAITNANAVATLKVLA
jgi:hypothetical protein